MKIFYLAFIALSMLALVSCNSISAKNYSEDIVKMERSLTPDMEKTENQIASFATSEKFDSFAAVAGRMEAIVDSKLQEVIKKEAPKVKEGQNFKEAAVRYFAYIKSIYTGYKVVGLSKTDEERRSNFAQFQQLAEKKKSVSSEMMKAQEKYAKANGFKIDPSK